MKSPILYKIIIAGSLLPKVYPPSSLPPAPLGLHIQTGILQGQKDHCPCETFILQLSLLVPDGNFTFKEKKEKKTRTRPLRCRWNEMLSTLWPPLVQKDQPQQQRVGKRRVGHFARHFYAGPYAQSAVEPSSYQSQTRDFRGRANGLLSSSGTSIWTSIWTSRKQEALSFSA